VPELLAALVLVAALVVLAVLGGAVLYRLLTSD
jgi:hypothetical protein